MGNFFTVSFWLAARPGDLLPISIKLYIASAVIFLAVGVAATWYQKNKPKSLYRKVVSRTQTFGFTNFFINLLLLFFAYETVPVLSMRLWFLIWAAVMITWAYYIYQDTTVIPGIKAKIEADKKFKQYIP
jgi:ABC-type dipeptide/oligopeptide/nickel transport system permease component